MPLDETSGAADPFYYLNNFHVLLETLQRRDADLLDDDERRFTVEFSRLPIASRALLVRMVMRKGPLFRATRLVYREITDVAAALEPLVALGWLHPRPLLSLDELFRLVTTADLVRHATLPRGRPAVTKAAWLEDLRTAYPAEKPFDEWCSAWAERVYRLEVGEMCHRLQLMFFGNFRQDLTQFVLADLGIFKYERIELHAASRPFRTRRQVDEFHGLYRCREMLAQGVEPGTVAAALPPPAEHCDWLQERRDKVRFQIGRTYERAGDVEAALAIYSSCAHQEAQTRGQRLRDRQNGVGRVRIRRANPPEFVLTIDRGVDPRSVERLALEQLTADGEACHVRYVENGLINSLFGLWCWPAIFAPVPGAFFHPFHHGPADLTSAGFQERREGLFARCFDELRSGAYKDSMRRRWVEKAGIASPFVAWGLIDEELLDLALRCFPALHLMRWFEWILRDVRVNRAGFPDLVQFWPGSDSYRLVEVKGPGDRLQENQRRCFQYCLQHDIPVAVCHVRWCGAMMA
jgi:hypothetical protein